MVLDCSEESQKNQVNRDFRGFWASEALRGSYNLVQKKIKYLQFFIIYHLPPILSIVILLIIIYEGAPRHTHLHTPSQSHLPDFR